MMHAVKADMRECWNWQTGTFEVRVSMTYGFKSRFSHQQHRPRFGGVCVVFLKRDLMTNSERERKVPFLAIINMKTFTLSFSCRGSPVTVPDLTDIPEAFCLNTLLIQTRFRRGCPTNSFCKQLNSVGASSLLNRCSVRKILEKAYAYQKYSAVDNVCKYGKFFGSSPSPHANSNLFQVKSQ